MKQTRCSREILKQGSTYLPVEIGCKRKDTYSSLEPSTTLSDRQSLLLAKEVGQVSTTVKDQV